MRFFGYFAQFSAKTLLDWVRPPPLSAKKSKKISVFSVKEILDSTRPPSPPFGQCPKKNSFFRLIAPLRWEDLVLIKRANLSIGVEDSSVHAASCHVHSRFDPSNHLGFQQSEPKAFQVVSKNSSYKAFRFQVYEASVSPCNTSA